MMVRAKVRSFAAFEYLCGHEAPFWAMWADDRGIVWFGSIRAKDRAMQNVAQRFGFEATRP